MKKLLSVVLVIAMLLFLFGCSDTSSDTESSSSDTGTSSAPMTSDGKILPNADEYIYDLMNSDYWPAGVSKDIPVPGCVSVGNYYKYEDGSWVLYLLCTNAQVDKWEDDLKASGFEGENGTVSNGKHIVEYSSKSDKLSDKVKQQGAETMLVINIKDA